MNTRILFFRPPTRNGSLYFRYEQYFQFLRKRGAQVRWTSPNPKGEAFIKKVLLYPWRFMRALPDILWANTIVISPSPNMLWTVSLFKGLGKRVISEHYVSYVSHAEWIPRFPVWMDQLSFSMTDHIITH